MGVVSGFFNRRKNMIKVKDGQGRTAWIPKGHENEYVTTFWGVFKKDEVYSPINKEGHIIGTKTGWEWHLYEQMLDRRSEERYKKMLASRGSMSHEEFIRATAPGAGISPQEMEEMIARAQKRKGR